MMTDREPRPPDSGSPPLPPGGPGRPSAGGAPGSGYGMMVGGRPPALGPPGGGPGGPSGPGGAMGPGGPSAGPMGSGGAMSQGPQVAIRMAMEIDMQLKQLAQIMPLLSPWAQQVSEQLKVQLSQAMNGAGAPMQPATGMQQFPDGTGRL